jgi:hypothetical protein
MSYRDQFQQYLDDVARGRDEMARSILFFDWAGSHDFECEGCPENFTPDPEGLDEDANVLCQKCLAWNQGYDAGRKSARRSRR